MIKAFASHLVIQIIPNEVHDRGQKHKDFIHRSSTDVSPILEHHFV